MATISSHIENLAKTISESTAIIQAALRAQNLPEPTFEPNVSVLFPPEITIARNAVLDATQELHDLLLHPMNLIQRKAAQNQMAHMKAISQYKIAECLAPGEEMSYGDLSKACGLDEKHLRHLLRHGMLLRIFKEPRKGIVAHTAASALIRDPSVRAWLHSGTHELWPSSVHLVDALAKWPGSEEPNHTGWNLAHRTDISLYQKLGSDPVYAKEFGDSMHAIISINPAFDAIWLNRSYDWAALGSVLVVDLGGSRGASSIALAKEFPLLRFISQDFAITIQGAKEALPADVAGRIEFQAHNFFTPQPVQADVYVLRWILHNWSDKYSVKILQALIPALKPGARILIQDGCLPDPGTIPQWMEKDIREMDLIMSTLFNAHERDADEWAELFTKAGAGFKFKGIKQPLGSALAVIEAQWEGNL